MRLHRSEAGGIRELVLLFDDAADAALGHFDREPFHPPAARDIALRFDANRAPSRRHHAVLEALRARALIIDGAPARRVPHLRIVEKAMTGEIASRAGRRPLRPWRWRAFLDD